MTLVKATPNPIVVDKAAGQSSGTTGVNYEKDSEQELWERNPPSGPWSPVNVHVRTGLGDKADLSGSFPITLKPGQNYELAVFEQGHGPSTSDPIQRAIVTVFCLLKKPEAGKLISDQNRAFGGTWYSHQTHTNVTTSIVEIGVSRTPPVVDANGLPRLQKPDGGPAVPPTLLVNDHKVELRPLFPGQHYFFVVIVADDSGSWDVRQEEFTLLRRKLTVEFPTLHIYNDGDPAAHGEADFWFEVYTGSTQQSPKQIASFYRPTADIDDWSETDRPYALGFAHVGGAEVIAPEQLSVFVRSRGTEHDGVLESDEGAWSHDVDLQLPSGRFIENVSNSTFLMDCPIATDGDDFHYGVDVRWSVDYVK